MKRELRFIPDGDLRVVKQGDKRKIVGYATKFTPVQSADLGGFVEEIHPNAFDECLRSSPDVRGLWNHDANHVLGRTKSGTLRLSTDKTGLQYEIDPPNTNLARDLMESMDRGDVDQSSFGFYCIDDSWREGPNGTYIRTVLKAELFDVSPVTFPAYPDATSGTRGTRHVRALFPDGDDELLTKVKELRAAKEATAAAAAPAEEAPGQGSEVSTEENKTAATAGVETPEAAPAAAETAVTSTPEENSAAPIAGAAQSAPEARSEDDTEDGDDDCDCDCTYCEQDDCDNCANERCMDKRCLNCAMQMRSAHETELLQLRLKLHQHRAKTFQPVGQ